MSSREPANSSGCQPAVTDMRYIPLVSRVASSLINRLPCQIRTHHKSAEIGARREANHSQVGHLARICDKVSRAGRSRIPSVMCLDATPERDNGAPDARSSHAPARSHPASRAADEVEQGPRCSLGMRPESDAKDRRPRSPPRSDPRITPGPLFRSPAILLHVPARRQLSASFVQRISDSGR